MKINVQSIDWLHPKRLDNETLAQFVENHDGVEVVVGRMYNCGIGVVNGVRREIAKRLREVEK